MSERNKADLRGMPQNIHVERGRRRWNRTRRYYILLKSQLRHLSKDKRQAIGRRIADI
jgi:hypothetical protein